MSLIRLSGACALSGLLLASPLSIAANDSPAGVPGRTSPTQARQIVRPETGDAPDVRHRHFSFLNLANGGALRLRPADGAPIIHFGHRADEVVTKATVKVRYAASPALIPVQSHVKLLLNGQVAGILPVTAADGGREKTLTIDIDPKRIDRSNKLAFQFIGHYAHECEDPMHLSLWLDVMHGSEVSLVTRQTAMQSDLASLPQPFFDENDLTLLWLPYVFGDNPSPSTLQAAGVTSSWFGKLASERQSRFPVFLNALPSGHAVVLATNGERPAFLRHHAAFTGPAISIVTNPRDNVSKLLLLTGRDGRDLRKAANALVLGNAAMSGAHLDVIEAHEEAPRKPYDAPNWVRMDGPTKLGDLVRQRHGLQVFGHEPAPLRVDLRIPPDLFTWQSQGVPVDLRFNYTTPALPDKSSLRMHVNGDQVKTVALRSAGYGRETARVIVPVQSSSPTGEAPDGPPIPSFMLGDRNQLDYLFSFDYLSSGACRDTQVQTLRATIDPETSIDFSSHRHHTQLPHLGYFATMGYPFTKYADLQQTAVVLPHSPTPQDIEAMLTMLGRMGESTGYPATRFLLASPDQPEALADRDVLLIGEAATQPLLQAWSTDLPAILTGPSRRIGAPAANGSVAALFGFGKSPPVPEHDTAHVRGEGPLGALLGYESPVTPGRSVVALTGAKPGDSKGLLDMMEDSDVARSLYGSVVLVHAGRTESMLVGSTYMVGTLPLHTAIWYRLSEHPVGLAFAAIFAVFVFAAALWRLLNAVAKRRLG